MSVQNVHKQFEEMLRGHCAEYHNHKETMAHAAVVIQLGLFAWIIMADVWPPKWVNDVDICMSRRLVTFIVYLLMWFAISGYTVWQLWNRRKAAQLVASLLNNIKTKIKYEPKNEILEEYFDKILREIKPKWFTKSDYFIFFGYLLILFLVGLKTFSKT